MLRLIVAVDLVGKICQAFFVDRVIDQNTTGFEFQYPHEAIPGGKTEIRNELPALKILDETLNARELYRVIAYD